MLDDLAVSLTGQCCGVRLAFFCSSSSSSRRVPGRSRSRSPSRKRCLIQSRGRATASTISSGTRCLQLCSRFEASPIWRRPGRPSWTAPSTPRLSPPESARARWRTSRRRLAPCTPSLSRRVRCCGGASLGPRRRRSAEPGELRPLAPSTSHESSSMSSAPLDSCTRFRLRRATRRPAIHDRS